VTAAFLFGAFAAICLEEIYGFNMRSVLAARAGLLARCRHNDDEG
jgi:hypothetical protein